MAGAKTIVMMTTTAKTVKRSVTVKDCFFWPDALIFFPFPFWPVGLPKCSRC
jgi:hypothetical protein